MKDSHAGGAETLRCYLAGLVFRFEHVTAGTGEEFAKFEAGHGVRTPQQIVRHMTGLVLLARDQFEEVAGRRPEPLPWPEEKSRFVATVWDFDTLVSKGSGLREDRSIPSMAHVWNGPLSDLMTHVGQLATLRRLAGDPVPAVRYSQVDCPGPPKQGRTD